MPTPEFVDFQRLSASRLFRDYVSHFEKVQSFYAGNPRDREAWQAIAAAREKQSFPRAEVASWLDVGSSRS